MDDVIWIVRHGEREDVAHLHSWISRDEDSKYQHLPDDDPPLSTRGRQQSTEVGHYLRNMSIAHIFSSPFDRCVETASLIVAEFDNRSTVNIESNIGDVLYDYPPGYRTINELKSIYPSVNLEYIPVVNSPLKWEPNSSDCIDRVQKCAAALRDRYRGPILIVSHGAPIASMLALWIGDGNRRVGVATVTKLVPESATNSIRYRAELVGSDRHLSDKTNLRAFW